MGNVLDRILGFLGVSEEYDEEEQHDDYFDDNENEALPLRPERVKRSTAREVNVPRKTNLVSLTGGQKVQAKMLILEPIAFEDVRGYVEHLKGKRSVILRLTKVNRTEAQRIVDFMSGATHALEGNMRKLGEKIFCFTPPSVEIEGDVDANFFDMIEE